MAGWICDSSMQKEKVLKTYSPQILVKHGGFNMVFQVFKQSPFSNNPVVIMAKLGDKKTASSFLLGVMFTTSCRVRVWFAIRGVLLGLVTWCLSPENRTFNITFHLASTSLFLKKTLGSFLLQIRYILQSLGGFPFSHSCQGRNEHVYFTTVGVVCA